MKAFSIWGCFLFMILSNRAWGEGASSFINFETAPVHPVALSPDRQTLAVCNLPDGRVELFDVSSGTPVSLGEVRVGVDPVSLRFRTTNELWVVNHISTMLRPPSAPSRFDIRGPDACWRQAGS